MMLADELHLRGLSLRCWRSSTLCDVHSWVAPRWPETRLESWRICCTNPRCDEQHPVGSRPLEGFCDRGGHIMWTITDPPRPDTPRVLVVRLHRREASPGMGDCLRPTLRCLTAPAPAATPSARLADASEAVCPAPTLWIFCGCGALRFGGRSPIRMSGGCGLRAWGWWAAGQC